MIRILQSVSNMDRGGIETMLMNYYRHLDRDQFQFDFLVNKEKPGFFDDEVRSLGGRIFMGVTVCSKSICSGCWNTRIILREICATDFCKIDWPL